MKPKSPWAGAHVQLKRLYEERVPDGMSQKEFGKLYGIGSQSMVAQYLNGIRPLNYETAAKFAKALHCTIHHISPEMAESLKDDIVPVLGPKAWLRAVAKAAMVLAALLFLQPVPSEASTTGAFSSPTPWSVYYVKWLLGWWRWVRDFLTGKLRISPKFETTRYI